MLVAVIASCVIGLAAASPLVKIGPVSRPRLSRGGGGVAPRQEKTYNLIWNGPDGGVIVGTSYR